MVRFKTHANVFSDTVIVMAGNQRVQVIAAVQAKRIKDVGPTKLFMTDHSGKLAVIIMDDIVGSEQNID